ncbi:hypothetical protein [Streptomyces atroolivaceus]|uniref:hypothetical protein n=1 Tax=Streptomyces atroolivaceus TaxID=66869 RepID=UPI002023E7A2|nr:hypothetical protein [Streptomyces atroolivaceus]
MREADNGVLVAPVSSTAATAPVRASGVVEQVSVTARTGRPHAGPWSGVCPEGDAVK